MMSFILWMLSPLFRYKLRQLERFAGRESYTAQMKRLRLISVLRACLTLTY
jgi:hypothetical protein